MEPDKRIEEIDSEIRRLFEERLEMTKLADEGLTTSEIALRCRKYEREQLGNAGDFDRVLLATIFNLSRSYKLTGYGTAGSPLVDEIRRAIAETPKTFPTTALVACQGVEGAYSQIAADKLFAGADIRFFKNFEGVFKAVEDGVAQYGVLPIENSTYGSVIAVYDLMRVHKFHIVRSIRLKINHRLMAKNSVALEDIREVFSHEQALGQCSEFLKNNPQIKVTIVANTAMAARMVADSSRTDVAAISSPDCAALYGLNIVKDDIMNSDHNYTRFICISKNMEIFPGASKISMMMALGHTPGSLSDTLVKFSSLGLNLTKIESRPIAGRDFEFMFYLDIDCSIYSEDVLTLIGHLDSEPTEFTFLGSYLEV
ncbi:chorismate mutase / prephenate dehydratase [Ruminococcaceae bacterium YRB3002]|nr:chorismate mutase / prephenate dehydratase [Ruminococcaceae bacterium YRB3002]